MGERKSKEDSGEPIGIDRSEIDKKGITYKYFSIKDGDNYRPAKNGESGTIPTALFVSNPSSITYYANRDGFNCHYCNQPLTLLSNRNNSVTRDHKIPKSKGGNKRGSGSTNIVLACFRCNSKKGDMEYNKFLLIAKGLQPNNKRVGMYNFGNKKRHSFATSIAETYTDKYLVDNSKQEQRAVKKYIISLIVNFEVDEILNFPRLYEMLNGTDFANNQISMLTSLKQKPAKGEEIIYKYFQDKINDL